MSEAAKCTLASRPDVTVVRICARRNICYEFNTSASGQRNLQIPYLVIVNGEVQNPRRIRTLGNSRKINLVVDAGSKVALYLNSDVHPDHRKNPVYEVTASEHDALIKITEVMGRINHITAVVGVATMRVSNGPDKPPVAHYQARLTGDIWMSVSHRYSESEANALLPEGTSEVVREAVCSIYRGLRVERLRIPLGSETASSTGMLVVHFQRARNAEENIVRVSLLTDVLPRTHPCAFAALFSEARAVGVTEMLVTSTWRPMFGSILHRAGLSLDIASIRNSDGEIKINREGLIEPGRSHNPNITDREKALYEEYKVLDRAAQSAPRDRRKRENANEGEKKWEKEVDSNQPRLMRELRKRLANHQSVSQIFDPWYMESDTARQRDPVVNKQASQNETTHDNHLHLTIREPNIYE